MSTDLDRLREEIASVLREDPNDFRSEEARQTATDDLLHRYEQTVRRDAAAWQRRRSAELLRDLARRIDDDGTAAAGPFTAWEAAALVASEQQHLDKPLALPGPGACTVCGVWTCSDCGGSRRNASRSPQARRDCPKCGSLNGDMTDLVHQRLSRLGYHHRDMEQDRGQP